MDAASLTAFLKQGLALLLMLSLPPVIVVAVVGLVVALLQAVTQVQEQSVGFGIKLVACILAIAATAQWAGGELYNFVDAIFAAIMRG